MSLHERSWGPLVQAGPPITYHDWLKLASVYPDQNKVWRFHETFARESGWACGEEDREHLELGGEA